MAMSDDELAQARGIAVEQVHLLRRVRGLPAEAIEVMPDIKLMRAVRRLEYPDLAGQRAAFRLLQQRDDQGQIPPEALLRAMRELDSLRTRTAAAPRTAGVPTGPVVQPGMLGPALETALLEQRIWKPIGPGNIGGRTRSIVIHPTKHETIWAGSVGGGIWRTDDGGQGWSPVDDFMANLAVTCMAVDPTNPDVICAGTGEGFYNTDALKGAGIFRTLDGTRWIQVPATAKPDFDYVNRLTVSADGAVLLAATRTGLWRSDDPGRANWTKVLHGEVADVKFSSLDLKRAVAGGHTNGTAWHSSDGGLSWQVATHDGPWSGRVELAYAAADPRIVYASVNVAGGQVYRSRDHGKSYKQRRTQDASGNDVFYLGEQGWYDNVIWAGDPTDPDLVLVGGIDLWRSTNGANTFVDISTWWDPRSAHADHHAIVAHPAYDGDNNRTVFFGNDGGVCVAADVRTVGNEPGHPRVSGWQELNNTYAVTQFYGGAGATQNGVIIGGAQDNGTLCYRPAEGSEKWREIFGGDGGFCAADPSDPKGFYGEYVYVNIHRNTDGGTTNDTQGDRYISGQFWNAAIRQWDWKPVPFQITDAMTQNALFIAPFVLDPNNPNRLLAGGRSLWRTNDAKAPNTPASGPSWSAIKLPTTSSISAIAVAQGNPDIIWVGHEDGQVYRTANGTAAMPIWQRVDHNGPQPLTARRFCTALTVDPHDHDRVFACFGGYVKGNVWRTIDGNATWSDIGQALPACPVRALTLHPDRSDWLYVGTEVGVFASEDSGLTWSPTNEGPTNCSVDDLFWLDKTLVSATHGRGMFTIDLAL